MLKFLGESSLVMKYQAQVEYQDTLIFDLLIPSLEAQKVESVDPLQNEISTTMISWGKSELLNYGYISTYHLWEKQIAHIIRDQSKDTIPIPKTDYVKLIRKILENNFNIQFADCSIWDGLDKARIIVNAYKHGFGPSFDEAKILCPELFYEDEYNKGFPTLEISEKSFKELLEVLRNFFDELDKQTDLDFHNW
jgi:hypothetical protein